MKKLKVERWRRLKDGNYRLFCGISYKAKKTIVGAALIENNITLEELMYQAKNTTHAKILKDLIVGVITLRAMKAFVETNKLEQDDLKKNKLTNSKTSRTGKKRIK